MSKESEIQPNKKEVETKAEVFLNELYEKILDWQKANGGKFTTEFQPIKISDWEENFSFNLQKGAIIKGAIIDNKEINFALVLGRGKESVNDQTELRLKFGFSSNKRSSILSDEDCLKAMINNDGIKNGQFYWDPGREKIEIWSWSNKSVYGGKDREISNLEDRSLIDECLQVVERMVIQSGK